MYWNPNRESILTFVCFSFQFLILQTKEIKMKIYLVLLWDLFFAAALPEMGIRHPRLNIDPNQQMDVRSLDVSGMLCMKYKLFITKNLFCN
jgi:hypothetical protein